MTDEPAKRRGYTWDDYRQWPDDKRWEIIAGEAHAMSPAPGTRHQTVVLGLASQLREQFRGRTCRVFAAPTDVKLTDLNVVQPDVLVVCEPEKIKSTHIQGAPTLVVEVLSPASALHDRVRKMALYARSGVAEVWLVTPYPWLLEVFHLDGETYRLTGSFTKEDVPESRAFPWLKINLAEVFDFPLEPGEETLIVREVPPAYGRNPL